ncbi:MAG: hypothetical protein NT007_13770 [Candidatus Kapabacteria bacterium]|nr:hypothetical protein [Candidatus Kapabacteria bacterium]
MNEDILKQIIELAKQFHVTKLIQFGSSLDSEGNFNDFDFACDGIYDKRFFKFGADLEKLLKKQVDLIPMQPNSTFIEHITQHGRVLYESAIN